MPAQRLDDRLGRQRGDPPLEIVFPGEGAAENEVGIQPARDGRIARARELPRLQQPFLPGLDLLRAEAVRERLADLLVDGLLDAGAILRSEDGEDAEGPALVEAVRRQERAEAVGPGFLP